MHKNKVHETQNCMYLIYLMKILLTVERITISLLKFEYYTSLYYYGIQFKVKSDREWKSF